MNVIQNLISRNFTKGRGGIKVNMVVIHIMEGHPAGTLATFNDPARSASAHYGIGFDGQVYQYVSENDTAWHCGSTFRDNQRSIGIEHEGFVAGKHWTPEQMDASAELTASLLKRYGLTTDAIVGHRDLKPLSGHTCPGDDFNMTAYKAAVNKRLQPVEQADAQKSLTINMPLFYDRFPLGSIAIRRSTGKAFFIASVSDSEMRDALRAMGYGSILK